MKSIYLNDSKYTNNLRHSLRIFFEREVKRKPSPTLFGTVFKGSKWSDYQTYNINKMFTKSGLSYFIYIISLLTLFCFFLGRSKSEQYFGFLPFFSYINFLLGYVPLLIHDTWSQVLLFVYFVYLFLLNYCIILLNGFSSKFIFSLKKSYNKELNSPQTGTNNKYNSLNIKQSHKSFNNQGTLTALSAKTTNSDLYKFSKTLKLTETYLTNLRTPNYFSVNKNLPYHITTYKISTNIANPVPNKESNFLNKFITNSEVSYTLNKELNTNTNTKNTLLTIADVYRFNKSNKYQSLFNFNINTNFYNAKQQRWATRNSLMSASIINNSFSITQVKKLIGIGYLNSQNSSNSLWLPTKLNKLNTIETNKQINNLPNFFKNILLPETANFLKYTNLNNSNFNNLNFFESSRLYIFKKYFFTNQTSNNGNLSNPILNDLSINNRYNTDNSLLFTKTYKSVGYNHLNIYDSLYNNLSVSSLNTKAFSYKNNLVNSTSNLNLVNLNINSLDILNNLNMNLFLVLTSNIQNNTSNWKYFNINTNSINNVDINTIKFTK